MVEKVEKEESKLDFWQGVMVGLLGVAIFLILTVSMHDRLVIKNFLHDFAPDHNTDGLYLCMTLPKTEYPKVMGRNCGVWVYNDPPDQHDPEPKDFKDKLDCPEPYDIYIRDDIAYCIDNRRIDR